MVSSYRLPIVTFRLIARFGDIAAFVLQHATFPHPTSSLLKIFPCSPAGGWPFGYEERRCWANCPCNQFPRLPTYVILIHQRHRRTDRRTSCNRNTGTALCTIVHCAVKIMKGGWQYSVDKVLE